jgi:superfamily II DNA or RNA helicase
LDIGFDQKDVANCIFLASNKNQNQLIQRIGRGVRKAEGKEYAGLFVVYAKNTGEKDLYGMINKAIVEGRTENSNVTTTVTTSNNVETPKPVVKPAVSLSWKNGVLIASGRTFDIKDSLKSKAFRWVPESKVWSKFCTEDVAQQVGRELNLPFA